MFDTPVFKILARNDTGGAPGHQGQREFNCFPEGSLNEIDGTITVVAYRGEYGPFKRLYDDGGGDAWGLFQTHLPSLSFGSLNTAAIYANIKYANILTNFNSRIFTCNIKIKNPFINNLVDQFIFLDQILNVFGREKTIDIAINMADYVENTNIWHENFCGLYSTVKDYVLSSDFSPASLYFSAYAFLDEPEYVNDLRLLGYDGAVHMGCGANFGEVEYRVFNKENVKILSVEYF